MEQLTKYRLSCTLSFGDIYGQIMVWIIVIFLTLSSALALWSSARQIYALATVGLVLVISLPFLLFAFVTTLLNHLELTPMDMKETTATDRGSLASTKKPIQAASWLNVGCQGNLGFRIETSNCPQAKFTPISKAKRTAEIGVFRV